MFTLSVSSIYLFSCSLLVHVFVGYYPMQNSLCIYTVCVSCFIYLFVSLFIVCFVVVILGGLGGRGKVIRYTICWVGGGGFFGYIEFRPSEQWFLCLFVCDQDLVPAAAQGRHPNREPATRRPNRPRPKPKPEPRKPGTKANPKSDKCSKDMFVSITENVIRLGFVRSVPVV